jgi:hypothetical protein
MLASRATKAVAAAMMVALLSGIVGCAAGASQPPGISAPRAAKLSPIVWNKSRPLTWSDFQGDAPADKAREGLTDRLAGSVGLAHAVYEAAETMSSRGGP